jgi:hypothetical protein
MSRTVLIPVFISLACVLLVTICGCATKGSQGTANAVGDDPVATVTYCDLLKHPERFHNKVVRVNAIFANSFEKSSLSDEDGCSKGKPTSGTAQSDTWVSYDKSFVMDGDSDEAKTNRSISGFGKWSITAVGRFRRAEGPQRFGHLACCRYEFALIKIEKSEKLHPPKR